uniref:Transposase (Putative), gypsy type n=1 Tax=Tanacetum cinerariifolium TaxID=118510 RepID=A0A699GMS3_TANCI|nr:hypothetical protein [Tanacetum cinerariifolium]
MDLFAFIQVTDPTKVKVRKRERAEEGAKLLDFTVGRGSADQVDFAVDRGQEVETGITTGVIIVAGENVVAKRPKRDYEASSDATIHGKSLSALRELLASILLNVEVGVAAVPMVTSSVSATPKHESGAPADSIIGLNIRTISASERFVISSDSSHHSSTHASEAEGDSIIRFAVVPLVITEVVVTSYAVNIPPVLEGVKVTSPLHAFLFQDSDSTETNVLNDFLLDDYDVSREFVDHLAPPALFSQIRKMDYHHLFTEFNVGTARQACLNVEVRMRTEDVEIESLKAHLLLKETKAAKAVHLRAQVSAFEAAEKMRVSEIDALKQKNVAHENEKGSLDVKVTELLSSVSTKDLELKELNPVVSSLGFQKDGLTGQVHELEAMCFSLRGQEYLSALRAAIIRAIEKGMQDGLSAGIDHGKDGRSLEDVAAYNLFTEADYTSALQSLREVDFPLLAELKSHKDASTADVMDLLCLEGPLADAPGMSDLQPNIEQLKLPIHHPEDQVILVETSFMEVTATTTTALSVTFASASIVPPITIEDYEIIGTDGLKDAQESGQGEASSFPYTVEFEKAELDTTPERNLAEPILYWCLLIFLLLLIDRGRVWPFCSGFVLRQIVR